ncbi:MAG: DUF2764 family protein [Gaiellales bacterium]|nr:DUF2764 family protein [Gaiellales bacterium]
MSYAYFMASLPLLWLQGELPLTSPEFLDMGRRLLSAKDFRGLEAAMEGRLEEAGLPGLRRYVHAEIQLRDALARLRAARAGVDANPFVRPFAGFDSAAESAAAAAMSATNPLERELSLDQFRWGVLEEISALDAFGLVAVYSYGLRLQIAEKWQRLSEAQGEIAVETIVKDNVAGIGL